MIELDLGPDEIGSLAYSQFCEIAASYRHAKPSEALKRLERVHALVLRLASSVVQQDAPKPKAGKRETFRLEFDELQALIHERLNAARKLFLASPYARTAGELARVIELQREYVKASRLAAIGTGKAA